MTNTGDHYDYDPGTFSRAVSTRSAEAQRWFDRGLAWCYAFGHEEAGRCFRLRDLVPGAGYLWRMPTHIDVQCRDDHATADETPAPLPPSRHRPEALRARGPRPLVHVLLDAEP